MSLKEELEQKKQASRAKMPEHVAGMMMRAAEQLQQSGIAGKSLKVGDKAPSFRLPNIHGQSVSFESLLKNGPLAISFYRGGWCPYCNLELQALQRAFPQIKNIGAQLIAISPQLPEKSVETVEQHGLSFEVLSDTGNSVARQFGLVFSLAEELRPIYKQVGNNIPAYNGDESWEIPIPATYVVDTDQTIVYAFVDPDYIKRLEPSEIIKAIKEMVLLTLKKSTQ